MDAIDILGGLLGGGKSGGSLGGKILKDLMGGARQQTPPASTRTPTGRAPGRPRSIDEQARQLEDLLGVAKDRHAGRVPQAPSQTSPQAPPQIPPQAGGGYVDPGTQAGGGFPAGRSGGGFSFDQRAPVGRREPLDQNEEALVLIRAMINAAKSDGRVTPEEQQEIMGRISNPTQDAIQFLRQEFSSPVNVREFAWSVPLGMEEKVYTLSLAAIDLDDNSEATYLRELAHGLRLPPECINQIHQQYGAPLLYR